jgi:ribosomal protein S18 acetylase RimI-like enzyme
MQMRTATGVDAPAIAELHAASWRHTYRGVMADDYLAGAVYSERLAVWTKRLKVASSNQYVLIAEVNERVAGFVCVYGREHPDWGSLLDNIHVDSSRNRQGIGAQLMRGVGLWCTTATPKIPLYLWVVESNTAAQAFYRKLGAADVGCDLWIPPGGGSVSRRRFSWKDPAALALLRLESHAT